MVTDSFSAFVNSSKLALLIFLLLLIFLPTVALAFTVVGYIRAHIGLQRLIFTFLSLILFFANWYFIAMVFDDRGPVGCPPGTSYCPEVQNIPIEGVSPVWDYHHDYRELSWRSIGLAYVDCFHYSVVTGSTVGFGDMHAARWYTKLLTDLHILLSLGLTAVGVSRYFANPRT